MAHLLVENGSFRGKSFPLRQIRTCLGRNAYLRDVLSEDLGVSREHAAILHEQDGYAVEDLRSCRGTLLNGRPLVGKEYLRDRDRLQLSGITLVFCQGDSRSEHDCSPTKMPNVTVILDDDTTSSVQQQVELGSELRAPSSNAHVIKALLQMIGSLTSTEEPDKILESLLGALFEAFPKARRGFVGTTDKDGQLDVAAVSFRNEHETSQIPVSRRLADLAISGRKALLVRDAALDSTFDGSESVFANEIRSVMCVPLFDTHDQPLGIIQLDTPIPGQHFDQDDLQLLADLAPQAAFVLKFRQMHSCVVNLIKIENDLKVAKSVHERLMPQSVPQIDGYAFFSHYQAARVLGGDFYNYVTLPDSCFAIVLADVEGKGIPAALFVARLAAELRRLLREENSLARIAERLNDSFSEDDEGRYLTMLLLVLDPRTHTVFFVNAGHWDPVLRRVSGEVICIGREAGGRPIGLFANETYESIQWNLEPGDSLVLFSDGFTDAANEDDQPFGHTRLLQEIQQANPSTLGQQVVSGVAQHIGKADQLDDMSLICLRRL